MRRTSLSLAALAVLAGLSSPAAASSDSSPAAHLEYHADTSFARNGTALVRRDDTASTHATSPLEYHAHTSFLRNGTALNDPNVDLDVDGGSGLSKRATTCPSLSSKGQIIAEYVPGWTSSAVSGVDWGTVDLAFWFCTLTSSTGIELATGTTISGMQQFVAAATAANKKPLLTVGGWSGSVYFSSLVATSSSRTAFATTLKTWLDTYGFAGVDLDWEFVGRQGAGDNQVSGDDAANYLAFLKVLRQTLGTEKLITAAVPAGGFNGADGGVLSDTSAYAQYFDYIELMAYDFYGSWSSTTGPNAALYTCNAESNSVEATVNQWLSTGFPACKMLLGVPAYSHRFSTASSTISTTTYGGKSTTAFQPLSGTAITDDGTSVQGLVDAGYLSAGLSKGTGGYTRYYDTCTQTPFLFSPSEKVLITYDDAQSFAAKAAYAKSKGLAGIAIYESTGLTSTMLSSAASALGHSSSSGGSSSSTTATTAAQTSTTTTRPAQTSSAGQAAPTAGSCSQTSDCTAQGYAIPANSHYACNRARSMSCNTGYLANGTSCVSSASSSSNPSSSSPTTTRAASTTPVQTTTSAAAVPTAGTCSATADCTAQGYAIPANSHYLCSKKACTWACNSRYTSNGSACVLPGASTATTTTSRAATTSAAKTTTSSAPVATPTCSVSTECTVSSYSIPANAHRACNKSRKTSCDSGYTSNGSACVGLVSSTTASAAAAAGTPTNCSSTSCCSAAKYSIPANSHYLYNSARKVCAWKCDTNYTQSGTSCVAAMRRFARSLRNDSKRRAFDYDIESVDGIDLFGGEVETVVRDKALWSTEELDHEALLD
ncbi:hypothetical protein JCM8097_001522 [Rhodosporidiobolus ruineniae]